MHFVWGILMFMILKIILGLIGLGIVVFVHELGHFLAARSVGIHVEAFSLGWGPSFLRKKIGGTEWRLSVFPVGGYCKMKGENDFQKLWENNLNNAQSEKDTFLGASAPARMWVSFAGPLFNIIFAVIVFSIIWGIGFEYTTMDNRIVLVQDVLSDIGATPAQEAGLKSGDKIIAIGKRKIENYRDIQTAIGISGGGTLDFTVLREGNEMHFTVSPEIDRSTGGGKIGVYYWADPIVADVEEGSAAEAAGIKAGDRIKSVNGEPLEYSVALFKVLDEKPKELNIELLRGNEVINTILSLGEKGDDLLGIAWESVQYKTPHYSVFGAIAKGGEDAWTTFYTSVKSLGLLFGRVDLTEAVSGPVRITYMVGDIAAEGYKQGLGFALRGIINFLALVSIALAVMNLLPLPILDGGLIVIFAVEMLRRKPLNPRFIQVFQTAGIALIAGIMIVALFGDIKFLAKG
ncbi:MAG: RIP metalloprotease RseP [Termitinemataceae bacterium]|nr:MAG: RIP metalloprotease RseP [Termitinemataceae bacterium]